MREILLFLFLASLSSAVTTRRRAREYASDEDEQQRSQRQRLVNVETPQSIHVLANVANDAPALETEISHPITMESNSIAAELNTSSSSASLMYPLDLVWRAELPIRKPIPCTCSLIISDHNDELRSPFVFRNMHGIEGD
jgi:hypothetical protein